MPISNLHMASSTPIRAALSRMKGAFVTRGGWLDAGNRYIGEAVNVLQQDVQANSFDNSQLTDYIAASVSIHCSNGWSYLSAAVSSLLEGDFPNSVHNAYYAELRSIMAFLAIQGIGVFGKQHILIDTLGQAILADSNASTHGFAKKAFDQWLKAHANTAIIPQSLVVEGQPLEAWVRANPLFPSTILHSELAADWLKDWSLDLDILQYETNFRNFVSYRPQSFMLGFTRPSDDITARLQFVSELWNLCAPNGLFGRSILRRSFRKLYLTTFNRDLSAVDAETEWKPMLQNLGMNPEDAPSRYLINFLQGHSLPRENSVFDQAANFFYTPPVREQDVDPVGIISRAALLLLVTTQAFDTVLRQAGLTSSDLQFWFEHLGIRSGYWETGNPPDLFVDLWEDIREQLDQMTGWLNDLQGIRSPYTFQQDMRPRIPHIHQLSRTYLWATGA
jgi:hypothetical protein